MTYQALEAVLLGDIIATTELCERDSIIEESDYDSESITYFFEDGSRVEILGTARSVQAFIAEENIGDLKLGGFYY